MERKQKNKEKGNGEGTLYKSSKTGLYIGQYVYNGKRKSVYQKKNEKITDFKKRFADILSSINQETYIEKNNITLYQILSEHIENKHKTGITSEATYKRDNDYLKLLDKCCSLLIHKPIQKVSIRDVKLEIPNLVSYEFTSPKTSEKVCKTYSQSIIDKLYRFLNKGFKIAISERIITFNLMDNIVKPKSKQEFKKVEALTLEEEKKLIKVIGNSNHKYKNIILLSLYTGMRIGEVLALSRDSIDFKENILTIERTLTRDKSDKVILGNKTKTKAGVRKIYLSSKAVEVLSDSLKSKITNMYNLVFYDYVKNTFITPSEINCYLRRLNEKEKICEHIHTHMLRHTYATRCIEAGMSAKVLQKNLGHSKIQTTLDTYTSVFEKFNKDENEKYDLYMKQIGI